MNKFDFKGRVAVVTGAARGLGLAITERLLDGGAAVSLWDLDRSALDAAAQRLGKKGKVHTAVVDVVNEVQVEAAATAVIAQLGRIVNLASIAGKNGSPYFAPYSTSKAAVIGLTKSMGKDLAKDGVIVNCIAPTAVGTDMVKAFPQKLVDSMIEQTPMGRMADASELSAMVAWMSSEECSFTTGGVFDISGGRATY